MYKDGSYFSDPKRGDGDAEYKVSSLVYTLLKNTEKSEIKKIADVGCGSGKIIQLLVNTLKNSGYNIDLAVGYDVSPHVAHIKHEKIQYKHEDFLNSCEYFDLITLNDVIEHVENPTSFIYNIGTKAKYVLFHIPIEDCLLVNIKDAHNEKIQNPGHLLYLNKASALNLVTISGLKLIACEWNVAAIDAPSERSSLLQMIKYPFQKALAMISPYLCSKIFGLSLVVLAKGSAANNTAQE